MSRTVALLLALIGGAAAALAAVMLFGGAVLGVLWLFVFGDDAWPAWVLGALNILIPLAGLVLWAAFGWQIWLRLRRFAR